MRLRIAALTFLLFQSSCASDRMIHGIPNLAQVESGVWRGGQPTDEGWTYLKSVGVTKSQGHSDRNRGTLLRDCGVADGARRVAAVYCQRRK